MAETAENTKVTQASDGTEKTNIYDGLEKQIEAEYNKAWKHQKPKKDQDALRLKLYNNQKRDTDAVGDTTMFTIHQTVLASLYDDRLIVDFVGKEEGDDETADNLNAMSESDYIDMEKDKLDFDWIWDTLFFGRGLLALEEFQREPKKGIYLPLPEVIDPMVFLRDTRATSINGDRKGRNACRYMGLEIMMTAEDIDNLPDKIGNIQIEELSHESGTKSIFQDASEARNNAQNRQTQRMEGESDLGVNAGYVVTRWYTHWKIDGQVKKVKVWLADERAKLLAVQVLDNQDYWQIIDRPMYPTAHDWDGTSVTDLTEDKQRARAIAQNLGLKAMIGDLYPNYIYDSNKITNRADLTRMAFNKHIPVESKGENLNTAILPLQKASPNLALLNFIYTSLDISAQKATATPDIQQGIQSEKDRPLGETNLIASRVDTRYSLSAKIFGWSEKTLWQMWYRMYKDNFKEDIDEKVLRIKGLFGPKWRTLKKDNITAVKDPDVFIESKAVNRAKQLEDRQGMIQYMGLAFQEEGTNRRYGLRKLGKLYGMEKDELDRLFPLTLDEREALEENELLNEDKLAPITAEQNHEIHLLEHSKANDTPATRAHLQGHQQAMMIKRTNPEFFPETAEDVPFAPQGNENTIARPQIAPSQVSA